MKKIKQIIALLLVLIFILSGCGDSCSPLNESNTTTVTSDNESTTYDFNFSIYDDDRIFTDDEKAVQSQFEDFLHELFVDELMSSSSINLHFMIEHPENYGIDKPEPNWGEFDYMDVSEDEAEISQMLSRINAFDYHALTYEQQLIYDILKEYLEDEQGTGD